MSFRPYKDSDDNNIVKLHVLYKTPLEDHQVAEAEFRLIPFDGKFYVAAIHSLYLSFEVPKSAC